MEALVIIAILVALFFDFLNGMHDAANSIATIVSTGVLSPKKAVFWAAWWNFAAAFFFGVHVATTVGKGIIQTSVISNSLILAALLGAICWNIITWYLGLPTSSSHALIGGLVGAGIAKAGLNVVIYEGVYRIVAFMVAAPALGLIIGFFIMAFIARFFYHIPSSKANGYFKRLQLLSAAFYSFGHGTNDAQKTMGIIAILLFTSGYLGSTFYVPFWVIIAAHAAIGFGTLAGGWRIVKTMGMKITKLSPVGGFSAETAGAVTLIGTALAGIPVSTTHTISGAIMGVGSVRRFSAVRWGVARRIAAAWVLTIPASAIVAFVSYRILALFIN